MTTPYERVFPVVTDNFTHWGLSKREFFAVILHAGLLADHKDHTDEVKEGETCPQATARIALEHADALIEQLNKP